MKASERFWAKVDQELDGCWIWTAAQDGRGYGAFRDEQGRTVKAHAFAWRLLRGPVPIGLQLDHLCRNRLCVNPGHLEPITATENKLRGDSPNARNARATTCKRGHPFDEANTYRPPRGGRQCRQCRAEAFTAWRKRNAAMPLGLGA